MKNMLKILLKILNFYILRKICIVYGHVFIVVKEVCPGSEVIKLFSFSTQMSVKFKLLIITEISQIY